MPIHIRNRPLHRLAPASVRLTVARDVRTMRVAMATALFIVPPGTGAVGAGPYRARHADAERAGNARAVPARGRGARWTEHGDGGCDLAAAAGADPGGLRRCAAKKPVCAKSARPLRSDGNFRPNSASWFDGVLGSRRPVLRRAIAGIARHGISITGTGVGRIRR